MSLSFDDEPQPAAEVVDAAIALRVNTADKRIINGKTDVNQLVPFKYKWAWDKYLAGCANHWMPQEVNMQKDIEQWKNPNSLTEDERRIVKRNLGFFVTADSLAANNIVLGTYRHITAPECRQYLLRQAFEEAIHCYIDGTEILTPSGFKDFNDLQPGELVAQYHKDGSIDFVVPDEILHDPFDGEMIRFQNESGTYLKTVTPNHRCVVIDPSNGNEVKIVLAKDLSPHNYNFPVAGRLSAGNRVFTAMDALRVAYQADGNLRNAHVVNQGAITGKHCYQFQFQRPEKIDRLQELAKHAGVKYENYGRVGGDGITADHYRLSIWVPDDAASTFDKDFAWINLDEISVNWIEQFFAELTLWDGSTRNHGSICYTNTNRAAIDKVTTLAHLCGRQAGLYQVANRPEHHSFCWQVHIYHKEHTSGRVISKESVPYKGLVHCVGVPTGMIVVRSEGRISVSGNTHAYQYIVESLGLDEKEIFNAYNEIPSIREKDQFLIPFIEKIADPLFETGTTENDQALLKSLIVFACLMEGLFFYVGFTQIIALGRQNKMTGAAEQYQYILRDESMHCNFGIDLINALKMENQHLWTPAFKEEIRELFLKAVELEYAYAEDTMPRGVLGLNATQFKAYLRFIANRRAIQIGIDPLFPAEENPFPWMAEMIDMKKEKNFFETRVTEYQVGGLNWD